MTFNDRLEIERGLKMNESLTEISKSIDSKNIILKPSLLDHKLSKDA